VNFTLIGYSEMCFSAMGRGLPEKHGGKFIHVMNYETDMEYIAMSPAELSVYHAGIAERFMSGQAVTGAYNSKRDYYQIRNPAWDIVGGGMWELDGMEKTVSFFGRSQAYGFFDPGGPK